MRVIVFIVVVLSIWTLEHLYVGWRLLGLPVFQSGAVRASLQAVLVVGWLAYPLGRIAYAIGWHASGRMLEYIGAVWMGIVFLVLGALLAVDVATLGGRWLTEYVAAIRAVASAVAVVAALFAWVCAALGPRLVEHEVRLPGLPPVADGTVLVQLSDVHLGTILGGSWLDRIVERVNGLEPDVIVITGDLIDGDAGVVGEFVPQLRALRAEHGVLSILGNHEYYAGRVQSRKLMTDAGFEVLDNRAAEVLPGLWIAGVPDDRGSRQTGVEEADLERTLEALGRESAVVLLQHAPENEQAAAAFGVDLMLNGHTHGGQLWPFHVLVRMAYPNYAGRYQVGAMTQIVSRGTGQWGPPMRLFAPAEIIRITLRSKSAASGG